MAPHGQIDRRSKDFLAHPLSTLFWWGLPLLAGLSTNVLPITATASTFVWAAAFAWMGVGCTATSPLRFCSSAQPRLSRPGWGSRPSARAPPAM